MSNGAKYYWSKYADDGLQDSAAALNPDGHLVEEGKKGSSETGSEEGLVIARRVSEGDKAAAKGSSYTAALLMPKTAKPRSSSGDVLGRGLRKRGATAESTTEWLHPRASISVPMLPASEFVGEASILSCVLSMTNSVMGAGILTFPYCFAQMGVIPGILIVFANAFFSGLACFFVMIAAKTMTEGTTFSDLGWKTFPKVMKYVDFLNFFGSFGSIVAYLVVIGDVAPDAFKHIAHTVGGNEHSFFLGRNFMISLFSVVFLIPMIPAKTFDNLKYVTMFSMGCFIYIMFVVVLYAIVPSLRNDLKDKVDTGNGLYNWPQSGWIKFCAVFSIIVLAFSATQNAVPVAHELKDNTVRRIALVCVFSFLLCAVIYTVVGLAGFASFGDDTESDILLNYNNSWLVTVVRIGLAVAVTSCYRLWHHPARENVAFMLLERSSMHPDTTRFQFLAITYGLWVVSYAISLFVDNLGAVMGLVGSVGILGSVFTVPGLLFYYRCTPAGGPQFYSPTGTPMPKLVEDTNSEDGAVFVNGVLPETVAVDESGVVVNEDPVSKWLSESGRAEASGSEGEWNVWPRWTTHLALFFAVGGTSLIPILLTIQILALK